MPSIRVKDLTKRFGDVRAVDNITFSVEDASLTTLLGPSGCGKTTTLRMLAGLERPDEGEIWIGDRIVYSSSAGINLSADKRHVGVVFQSYALWPHMRVFDQVAYPLRVRKVPRVEIARRVHDILDLVQLSAEVERYPSEISGGQQQRVALARALVFGPSVLLLDEPLSNLDAALRGDMRAELARLHAETGVTSVYVTHDQSEALALSDEILVMRDGHVVEQGDPRSIYGNPRTLYGALLTGSANQVRARVTKVGDKYASVKLPGGSTLAGSGSWLSVHDVGRQVVVIVRPEHCRVATPSDARGASENDLSNILAGTVRRTTYLGAYQTVVVAIGDELLHAQLSEAVTVSNDANIELYVPPDAVRILPDRNEPQPAGHEQIKLAHNGALKSAS